VKVFDAGKTKMIGLP